MPDIEASYVSMDVALCGKSLGKAYGSICLYLDKDLHNHFSLEGVGKVGSTSKGRGNASLELELDIPSTTAYVQGVCRGASQGLLSIDLDIEAKGLVRSVVTGAGRAEIAHKGEPFSPSPSRLLTPIYITKDLKILLSHWNSFLPEISMPVLNYESKRAFDSQQKVSIEVLKEYITSMDYIGDRRNWLVARVLYESCPVMYICNTGWQGIYHPTKYVLDRDRYQYMNFYLWSLMKADRGGDMRGLSGLLNDRQRMVQAEPLIKLSDLPKAIREVMVQVGDIGDIGG
jgi:hypothetical protein